MIDLPNLKLTPAQWEAIARKVLANVAGAEPSQLSESNVIDMFTRKPLWVKPAN